ncbi:MAG: aquaporin, partial [Phycisphaerales bacterium]|nr:aquaporin [Phycisphaerales bacterium]
NKLIVEFIGAFFLVFTIGMTVIAPGAGAMAPVAIGLVLAVMVYAGGHVSGGHYNPSVTIAVFLRGKCAAAEVAPYVISQLLASAAACFAVLYLKPDAPITPMEIVVVPSLIAEFLFTFALCFVVLSTATADANEGNSYFGAAIGLTVLCGAYSVGSISGGSFNPAVTLALGITGLAQWADLWVHLVAEIAGGVVAAVVFKSVVKPA